MVGQGPALLAPLPSLLAVAPSYEAPPSVVGALLAPSVGAPSVVPWAPVLADWVSLALLPLLPL